MIYIVPVLLIAVTFITGLIRGGHPRRGASEIAAGSVVFSGDGKVLFWSIGRQVGFWDQEARQIRRGLFAEMPGEISRLALSPDGKVLATGLVAPSKRQDGVCLWSVETTAKIGGFLPGVRVDSITFSPDGKTLACGTVGMWGTSNRLRVFDIATGKELEVPVRCQVAVLDLAYSPDGAALAVANLATLRFIDSATLEQTRAFEGRRGFLSVAFSPDGRLLGSSSSDGSLYFWELNTITSNVIEGAHKGRIDAIAFTPNGDMLASGGDDREIRLWDVGTRKQQRALSGHRKGITDLAFSPDGKTLASASRDGTVRVWDVATGQLIEQLGPKADH